MSQILSCISAAAALGLMGGSASQPNQNRHAHATDLG